MSFIRKMDGFLKEYSDRDCIADREGKRIFTYRQFDELSGKVAGKLQAKGIKQGDAVIICLGRCTEYVAAEYGAMRYGAVAIPIIPSYPAPRVDYIKKDADVKLVIREDFFDDIDQYPFDAAGAEPDSFSADGGEDPRRMIIYTSGSTGNPKGVVYRDRAIDACIERCITNLVKSIRPFIYAGSATMSFTVTLTEYYRTIYIGGTTHILSDETRMDIEKVQDYYARYGITFGFLSPRMLKVYKNKDKQLKAVITGSERVVNTFSDEFVIVNGYGQTETCSGVCGFRIDKPYSNTPVGTPRKGITITIVDEDGKEVPAGQEGYIIVSGILPYEYNNLPEQTAKTFERHADGTVSVHTGDIGMFLPDGNLVFVNRKDWMLKIHGQRVEPGEIEAAMNQTDGVKASVVKGFEQDDGSMLLCGFYTGTAEKKAIMEVLERKLPHYMIPNALVHMDAFPVNPNGKVDRTAIAKPDLSSNRSRFEAPENELEEKICGAMEKVLGLTGIGRNDDFYLLGGNSLNAVSLCSVCGIKGLSTRHIMLGKTPKRIAEQYKMDTGVQKPELNHKYEIRKEYPMTLSNRYNFYDSEKCGDTIDLMDLRAYYELDDEVDTDRLKKAVEDSLKAHKVYGIRFSPSRNIIRNEEYEAVVEEVIIEPEKFEEFRRNKAAQKRDLQNQAMFDIEIVHVAEKTYLYMNMTHQVFDGASLNLLYDEISDRYEGREPLAEDYDIFDVAGFESELEESGFRREALKFFDRQFGSLEKKPAGDSETHLDSAVRRTTSVDFSGIGKDEFLKQSGISEITYIQAALCLALSKVFDREQLTCKILHSGRDTEVYNNIHGSIARGVYVLANVGRDQTTGEFLNELQESYQNSIYYDVIPMQELAERYPQVDSEIYLNFRGKAGKGFHLGEKRFAFLPIGYFFTGKHIEALLNFQIDELADGRLHVNAGAGFFSQEKTERIVDAFEKALELIVTCEKVEDIIKGI